MGNAKWTPHLPGTEEINAVNIVDIVPKDERHRIG
jgi:hypothetical protein